MPFDHPGVYFYCPMYKLENLDLQHLLNDETLIDKITK